MEKEGIVGRGVLLDFHEWNQKTKKYPDYNPFQTGSITLSDLKAVAESQGTQLKFGDVLIIRSGKSIFRTACFHYVLD